MKFILALLAFTSFTTFTTYADTPPARTINSQTYDGSGAHAITSTNVGGKQGLDVNVANSITATVSGTVPVSQSGVWSVGRTWSLLNTTDSVNVGNFPSFALDSTLVALSAKFGTLGQKAMSGSAPVVIASDQTSIPVTGTFFQAVQPVSQSGTWTVLATQNTSPWVVSGSGNFTVVQPTGTNLHVVVDSAPTTTVTGTVTANIGTTGGLALDTTLSSLSSKFNTLGQKTMANSAPVVIASDQSSIPVTGTFFQAVQPVSQSGTWTVLATQNTSPWVSNISQFGGNNVVTGTGASGLGIPRFTVSNDSNILATQSGTWTTGRTWSLLNTTDSVNAVQSGSWSVTANAGTNLNTSLLQLDSTGAKLNNAQGSTTLGQTGPLIQGAVTTSAPSYTTAQTSPLSLTLVGALRTDSSATTQPISAASLPLPTGASTSANQTNGTQQTKITDGTNIAAVKSASTAAVATDPSLVTAFSPNSPLPTGTNSIGQVTANAGTNLNTSLLSTSANQTNGTQKSQIVTSGNANIDVAQGSTTSGQNGFLIQGAVTTNQASYTTAQTSPLSLTLRGGLRAKTIGLDAGFLVRNDYSSTNVTTAAYVQLIASTSVEVNRLHIFDSSGQDLVLATGASGSEVDQIQISPGGWDSAIEIYIPSGTRVSVKSKSATASSGILLITGLK